MEQGEGGTLGYPPVILINFAGRVPDSRTVFFLSTMYNAMLTEDVVKTCRSTHIIIGRPLYCCNVVGIHGN